MKKPYADTANDFSAHYWTGPISRREAQNVFDEYGAALGKLSQVVQKLDLVLALMVEKSGITVEEVQAFVDKKQAELEVAETMNPPPEPSRIIQ